MARNLQSEFSIFNGHKKHEDETILKAQAYLEENYQNQLSVEELAKSLNVGRRSFDRRFKKATNFTPLEYLQRIKVEVAKKSFENTRLNVNEVMYDVGYSDAKAFRDIFRKITGILPLDYRDKYNYMFMGK